MMRRGSRREGAKVLWAAIIRGLAYSLPADAGYHCWCGDRLILTGMICGVEAFGTVPTP
jgi:hypothetical protein